MADQSNSTFSLGVDQEVQILAYALSPLKVAPPKSNSFSKAKYCSFVKIANV